MSKPRHTSRSYRFLLQFFSRIPLPFLRTLAQIVAGLINQLQLTRTSKAIDLNLQIALPELSAEQRLIITQEAIRNELQSYCEFFNIWGATTEKNISRIDHITGEQYFHSALEENQGLVIIVPHFGTWEVMNAWVSQFTEMTIMYKPIKNEHIDDFVRAARGRERSTLVPTDDSGVRQIFKALKQGGTTVILPDHTPNIGGEMIEYFGIPLHSSNLSAKLIQKTKAKALFLYAIRNEQGGFDMHIEPLDKRIYDVSANAGTQLIHQKIEHLIAHYPSHYHWSYKRFKANPELANLYNIELPDALTLVQSIRSQAHHS